MTDIAQVDKPVDVVASASLPVEKAPGTRSGSWVEGRFVESAEFIAEKAKRTALVQEHVKEWAEHCEKAGIKSVARHAGALLLDLMGKPKPGQTVAHLMFDFSSNFDRYLMPDESFEDYSPLTTLVARCCTGGMNDSMVNAYFFEVLRRVHGTRDVAAAIKGMQGTIEADDDLNESSLPHLVRFWCSLTEGESAIRLAQKILNSRSEDVEKCAYFSEFVDETAKFAKLMADPEFWARKELAKIPEPVVCPDPTETEDKEESEEEEADVKSDDGADEGSKDNEDDDFDGNEDVTESETKKRESDEATESDEENSHPKKKSRVAKGFRERPAGSRSSARLTQTPKVNFEEKDEKSHDEEEEDEDEEEASASTKEEKDAPAEAAAGVDEKKSDEPAQQLVVESSMYQQLAI
jgi:hypothetical protein